jgi:hypothetical protein
MLSFGMPLMTKAEALIQACYPRVPKGTMTISRKLVNTNFKCLDMNEFSNLEQVYSSLMDIIVPVVCCALPGDNPQDYLPVLPVWLMNNRGSQRPYEFYMVRLSV